jgi:tetratricopeptide (TPR) repeat protein
MGVYFNVGQFGRATEILHGGLRDGSIESDQKNWELVAYSYQQVDQPFKAIAALKEGAKQFPKSGQLNYQMAQIYYSLNKPEDAFNSLQMATQKGGLEKPGAVYSFLGYVCWDLNKYPEALVAINKALETPDGKKDAQLPKLKAAVEQELRNRESPPTDAGKR